MLANDPRVVIFDFKARADAALAVRLYSLGGSALFEDPPNGFEEPAHEDEPRRTSRDASVLDERAVSAVRAHGEAVNLKAPRMGGPLELLRGLERAPHCQRGPHAARAGRRTSAACSRSVSVVAKLDSWRRCTAARRPTIWH